MQDLIDCSYGVGLCPVVALAASVQSVVLQDYVVETRSF